MQTSLSSQSESNALSVRQATVSDIPFLAEIDCMASTPPFEQSFWEELTQPAGTPAKQFLEAVLVQEASNWGNVEDAIVLELEGVAAAACIVYEPSSDPDAWHPVNLSKLGAIAQKLGWSTEATETFEQAYKQVWTSGGGTFLEPQAPVIVESVGVRPQYRGKGLGKALMEAAFAQARQKGHDEIGIMAIHGNEPARRLYEQFFEPYLTFHAAYFDIDFPGITKFKAAL